MCPIWPQNSVSRKLYGNNKAPSSKWLYKDVNHCIVSNSGKNQRQLKCPSEILLNKCYSHTGEYDAAIKITLDMFINTERCSL